MKRKIVIVFLALAVAAAMAVDVDERKESPEKKEEDFYLSTVIAHMIIQVFHVYTITNSTAVDLGGLGITCSPRDPRFADSNPAEVDGFFQDVKS